MDINIVTISGTITTIASSSILFRQIVGGKKETEFTLFLPAKIRATIKGMDLHEGDVILVTNGQIYEKNGKARIRITDPADLVRLSVAKANEPENHYLGTESADQFI